ncbi:MAG: M20 family metallo-hydrolase [Spirochaetales bacterium]|jgi:succinyl-diaminopimelate desuccinylase|nr:M20 family metallo-hydrolase [Spirochaetales bacterium]
MSDTEKLFDWIDSQRGGMIGLQKLLTGIPALAPESGGEGEDKKAAALKAWLEQQGLGPVENYPVKDERVPSGARPNLVVTVPGKESSGAFWVMSHLDVVPPGDLSGWATDPYTLTEKDGKLYGRGTEDNQQGLVSSVFAALALVKNGVTPPRDFRLLFAADEEVGSTYGIEAVLREHPGLFHTGDSFLVPDSGRPDGSMIEIAEKTILWLRFSVEGKQCHGSMPHLGSNAFVAGSALVLRLAETLPEKFSREDPIFEPPYSTFCPTRKEANVPNVNTIPGLDVFWMDCRILPSENVNDILEQIDSLGRAVEAQYKVKVKREVFQRKSSKPTSADCALVGRLKNAVNRVYGVEACVKGVGGGTVGAYLRNAGYDTVIWSTIEETCHMPNEYCVVKNMVNDAKVMLLLGG